MVQQQTRGDIAALFQSIQNDIDEWKSRNEVELERIQNKLRLLVASCLPNEEPRAEKVQKVAPNAQSGAGRPSLLAPGSQTPIDRRSKSDPSTPQTTLPRQAVELFHSERKPKSTDTGALQGFWRQLSEKDPKPITEDATDTGRVSFTVQELFPRKTEVPHCGDSQRKPPEVYDDSAAKLHSTPNPRRSFGGDSSSMLYSRACEDAPRTPFSQTPYGRTPFSERKQRLSSSPTMAIESILPMHNLHEIDTMVIQYVNNRPMVCVDSDAQKDTHPLPEPLPGASCQVLVEFKRNRVYQYDSPLVISPGKYAIVSGDRGDDLGLVIYSWFSTKNGIQASGIAGASVGKMIGLGIGKVVRTATEVEVNVVHNVLKDLEIQALEVCRARVRDLGIPMVVHDAEYQYDRKKLTFYYQSADRQDFRELIRDLYRTFKARIWMESVDEQ